MEPRKKRKWKKKASVRHKAFGPSFPPYVHSNTREMSAFNNKTYEVSGDTTEWDDILIKKGIKTKQEVLIEKGLNPLDYMTLEELGLKDIVVDPNEVKEETREERLDKLTLKEIDELEDNDDDDELLNDTSFIDQYREKRIQELKLKTLQNRFGDLQEIVKADWLREVNETSKTCWVVISLYQDSIVESRLLDEILLILAPKFKYIKFLKIKAQQAVENWPESRLPTLFLYNEGELKHQVFTLNELGGKSTKADDLEWYLVEKGIITDSELDENPRNTR